MFSQEEHEEWNRFSIQCDEARDEYFIAHAKAPNFMQTEQATEAELAVFAAESRFNDIMRQMDEYKEAHFRLI